MAIKVGIQGERGSFSEQAAEKLLGSGMEPVCCPSFQDLFSVMKKGKAQVAVVPIENTLAGSIHRNYDLLLESGLQITAETNLRIEHCLIGTPQARLRDIRIVVSHPVALDQCRRFFRNHRSMTAQETYDTAGAVQDVLRNGDRHLAAIAGQAAAQHFGGRILVKNIEDNPENFTRFFALEKRGSCLATRQARRHALAAGRRKSPRAGARPRRAGRDLKTSLVFSTKNVPGALFRCLSVFALRDINLSKIESRPLHGRPWQYLFYVDLLAGTGEERTRHALRHIKEITEFFKVLGCYPTV